MKKEIICKKSERGASAVEFALILPFLLLIVFGIIEFGIILYDQAMLTNASREGARAAIVFNSTKNTQTEIGNTVTSYISGKLFSFSSATPVISTAVDGDSSIAPETAIAGQLLTVNVQYTYDFLLMPDIRKIFGASDPSGTLTLSANTVMRFE